MNLIEKYDKLKKESDSNDLLVRAILWTLILGTLFLIFTLEFETPQRTTIFYILITIHFGTLLTFIVRERRKISEISNNLLCDKCAISMYPFIDAIKKDKRKYSKISAVSFCPFCGTKLKT